VEGSVPARVWVRHPRICRGAGRIGAILIENVILIF